MEKQPNTTIRVNREHGYVAMPRDPAMDRGLSNKALGLLYRILQFPDGWNLSVAGLVEICPDGKAAIMSGLKELETHGYLIRRRIRDDKGVFLRMEYIIYEHPQTPAPETPLSENQTMDTAEECAQPLSDFPAVENPALENPEQENPSQINNIINNNPPTPQGVAGNARYEGGDEAFDLFWAAYPRCPRKRDRQQTFRAWRRHVKPSEVEAVMQGLEWDKQSNQWRKEAGEYIPAPTVWINKHRWESATPPADMPVFASATGDTLPAAPEDWL